MGSWQATASSSAIATASQRRDSARSSKAPGGGSRGRQSRRRMPTPTRSGSCARSGEECLDRLILFGERRLLRALDDYVAHYHRERNHQGLGNEFITPAAAGAGGTQVRCRDRLGGLL